MCALKPATGSRLTLEHTFEERPDSGMFATGWHICLAVLTAVLDGHDVNRVVGSRASDYGWSALRDRTTRTSADNGRLSVHQPAGSP